MTVIYIFYKTKKAIFLSFSNRKLETPDYLPLMCFGLKIEFKFVKMGTIFYCIAFTIPE